MKLSQKIVEQRKQRGWSQEELAFRLNVSRQAVGKWESDLALPEVDKIVQMAKLFDVSCDYLLSDGAAVAVPSEATVAAPVAAAAVDETTSQPQDTGRRLSATELSEVAAVAHKHSIICAIATALCVLSPVVLIVLAGLCSSRGLDETIAAGVGLCVFLVMVALAVVLFVLSGKTSFADYNPDEASKALLRTQISRRKSFFVTLTAIACGLCVLSPIPLLVAVFGNVESLVCPMVGVLFAIVAIAVFIFVYVYVFVKSYRMATGECTEDGGKKSVRDKIQSMYWMLVVVAYFVWSFITFNWGFTWIIWPIAAVVSAVISIILDLCGIKRDKKD